MQNRRMELCRSPQYGEPSASGLGLVAVLDSQPAPLQVALSGAGYRVECIQSLGELGDPDRNIAPDCLVLSVDSPQLLESSLNGYLVARKAPGIVFTSSRPIVPLFILRAAEIGPVAIIRKPVRPGELLDAVRRLLTVSVRARRLREEAARYRLRFDSLTPRERDVFGKVVAGNLNKQIAAELGIAVKTVKVHRSNLMRKMQVVSLAALVSIAFRLHQAAESGFLPWDIF